MLSCIVGKQHVNVVDYSEIELRAWSKRKILKCPVCGDVLTYKHGFIKVPHFAHSKDKECTYTFYENETKEHALMKVLIYKQLQKTVFVSNLHLEYYIPETKQRPDLYFEAYGQKFVIECQCSLIAPKELKERKTLYRLNNIIDIWIFGTEKYNELKPVACQKLLDNYLVFNPFKNLFKEHLTKQRVTDLLSIIQTFYNRHFGIYDEIYAEANKINNVVKFLNDYLQIDVYSSIANNVCKSVKDNKLQIKIEPSDSNKNIKHLDDYLYYLSTNGNHDVYLNGKDFHSLVTLLKKNNFGRNDILQIVNNRGDNYYL